MSSSLVLLIALATVASCHFEIHQKKNVATSSEARLTTPMMEQQSSSIVPNQPFKIRPGMITTMFKKQPAIKAPQNIVCPDGKSQCASNNTCCLNQSGDYGCCPFLNAVCCSDRQHCCHLGYSCNPDGSCTQQHVICPDQSSCPLNNTCCPHTSGGYGCCPSPYATCCSDGEHCCDLGYACNNDGTCTKVSVVCPDQKNTCLLNNTCCKLQSGDNGCCPLPNAVCCPNDKCCPSGHICNSDGTCSAEHSVSVLSGKQSAINSSRPVHTIFPAKMYPITATLVKQPAIKAPQNIICPDGMSECASKNTCCVNWLGGYNCCPLLNAVCCSDRQHCCPLGYKCDIGAETCTQVNVVCPDQSSLCPLDNTCCLLPSGEYGCCPYPNAVCCSDGQHCCPEGYTCDLSAGKCIASYNTPKSTPCLGGRTCSNGNQLATRLSKNVNAGQDDFL